MNYHLSAKVLSKLETQKGIEGDVAVYEPNGDETIVHCVANEWHTMITGDNRLLDYFHQRYGDSHFSLTVRGALLEA